MEKLKLELTKIFEQDFIKANINGAIYKTNEDFKIIISEKQDKNPFYHFEIFYNTKVRHINTESKEECINNIMTFLEKGYKQMDIITTTSNYKILMNKKKNFKVMKKKATNEKKVVTHNKKKEYILQEGTPYPFLVSLDVMDKNGKVYSSAQKKFRQINKFLEELEKIKSTLPKDPVIVDVGCGKSYLTFAIFHYFTKHLNIDCKIIGLDIKEDVINRCNDLKEEMGYNDLEFYNISIEDFKKEMNIDVNMVVSLHACNTATDYALYSGVLWNTDVILSVPCCHKELYSQVKNKTLNPLLKHGILKEKFQSLLCDSVRGLCLEASGYNVSISEFIDESHTPKNTLILAQKTTSSKEAKEKALQEYHTIAKEFSIDQTLYNLLFNQEVTNER